MSIFSLAHNRRGMALLNMVFIFIFVGVLVVAGVKTYGSIVERAKINDSKAALDKAVNAIISWSVSNNRIPDTTATTNFATIIPNPKDAWGKDLVYLYDSSLTNAATGGLCGKTKTSYPPGCSDETMCDAFVLISGSNDYIVNSTPAASQNFPAAVTLSSSDIYRVVTLAELKSRAGCYGPTGGRLRIINNELPNACFGSPYTATVYATGGVPIDGNAYNWAIPVLSTSPLPTNYPSWLTPTNPSVLPSSIALTSTISPPWYPGSTLLLPLGGTAPLSTVLPYSITFAAQDGTPNVVQRNYQINLKYSGACGASCAATPGCAANCFNDPACKAACAADATCAATCPDCVGTSAPDSAQQFRNFVSSENVFVYGSQLSFSGSNVTGVNSTTIITGGLSSSTLNGDAKISVSNVYINGNTSLSGSQALGSSTNPGIIYIHGNLDLSGSAAVYGSEIYINGTVTMSGSPVLSLNKATNIHILNDLSVPNGVINGTVYVGGNASLINATVTGTIYVNNNLSLDYGAPNVTGFVYYRNTPISKPDSLYAAPNIYKNDPSKVGPVAIPNLMPAYTIPQAIPADWYTEQKYNTTINPALANSIKIFSSGSYTSPNSGSTITNVIIVSQSGDITINNSWGTLSGVLFAPNGQVTYNGAAFSGVVIAKNGFFVTSGSTPVTFLNISNYINDPNNYPF